MRDSPYRLRRPCLGLLTGTSHCGTEIHEAAGMGMGWDGIVKCMGMEKFLGLGGNVADFHYSVNL